MKFVRVPKEIIVNRSLDRKRVLVFVSAVSTMSPDVETLVKFAGLSYDRHKGGVSDSFSECLKSFIDDGFLELKEDGKLYQTPLNHSFGIVSKKEIDELVQAGKTMKKTSPASLFLVLAYVRASMIRESDCEYYSNYSTRMGDAIGMSRNTVESQMKALELLQILHYERLHRYKGSDGVWRTDVMAVVNDEENWQENMGKAISHILAIQTKSKVRKKMS